MKKGRNTAEERVIGGLAKWWRQSQYTRLVKEAIKEEQKELEAEKEQADERDEGNE